jgi:hypothetical protein
MERQILSRRRQQRRRIIALSLVSLATLILFFWDRPGAPMNFSLGLSNRISSRISSLLRLEQVSWEESGSTNLSERVTPALLWQVSGLKLGQEMFSISMEDLERRLSTIPMIESLQIQKKLPSTLVVRYSVHHARVLSLRKNRLWLISSTGKWIAPLETGTSSIDLPVITGNEDTSAGLTWLDALERELQSVVLSIHEINVSGDSERSKVSALLELRYPSQTLKLTLIAQGKPDPDSFVRLKRVVQYLIKNNILVSTIDLRPGKKVVVNVGKHL